MSGSREKWMKEVERRLGRLEEFVLKHDLVLESMWEYFDKDEKRMIETLAKQKAAERGVVLEES